MAVQRARPYLCFGLALQGDRSLFWLVVAQVCFRKPFSNAFLDVVFLFRPNPPAVDQSLNRVQQLQPIFQRWLFDGLPAIVSLFPVEKQPISAHVLGVNLNPDPLGRGSFPAYFCFWHMQSLKGLDGDKQMRKCVQAGKPAIRQPGMAALHRGDRLETCMFIDANPRLLRPWPQFLPRDL